MPVTLDPIRSDFDRVRALRRNEPAWLARAREEALHRFLALGYPTTREEDWRFTSVAAIAEGDFDAGAPSGSVVAADLDRLRPAGRPRFELVFVNGRHAPELSRVDGLPAGVYAGTLADAPAGSGEIEAYFNRVAPLDRQAFAALNTAMGTDVAFLRVPAHVVLEEPIHVLFVSTAAAGPRPPASHPRLLAVLGDDSQACIVERYAGPEGVRYFTNAVTEIALGDNAVVDYYQVQQEGGEGLHVATTSLRAGRSGTGTSHSISLGGALVRNDLFAVLDGEGSECTLNGLYVADGRRLVDNHTTVDHASPHCSSRELYKGILADAARGVFNGKIIVRPDAQKTDAKQTNRALLLSENAQINTKPQLEIFANDVKCTHGAAVGQLDEDAVFYLRSRGLSGSEARRLLVHAFAADVLGRMPLQPVRAEVEDVLQSRIAHALGEAA